MTFGRPTLYSQEIVDKTNEFFLKYFNADPFLVVEGKEGKITTIENPFYTKPPYIEQLALELGIDDDTIYEWLKDPDKKDFSEAIKRIKLLQKMRLFDKSMEKSSATGAIFQLKVNHNMIETERRELMGLKGAPIETKTDVNLSLDDRLNKALEDLKDIQTQDYEQ